MATPGVERLFVDTNILVYATDADSPWHSAAENELEAWRRQGTEMHISVQVLREYLAVTTRQAAGQPPPPDFNAILENLGVFRTSFQVSEDTRAVSVQLGELMRQFSVQGRQVHDAKIVATMQVQGLSDLLTHNTGDFTRYSALITVHPLVPAS
ncbi:MAG: PIN domain-containing protein [Verrucomicrobia bacterium]|nr:PIN domain-containing protein [Verrucomicrobiota bacterium]